MPKIAVSISIHAPPRGATRQHEQSFPSTLFQFTPLREGRRKCQMLINPVEISIHAPPRGATHWRAERKAPCRSFQFTPLREGRRGSVSLIGQPNSFQFTPLREGRLAFIWLRERHLISIHAPPRGATFSLVHCSSPHVFQFTPLREGRRLYRKGNCYFDDFNSRPSARGDLIMVPSLNAPMISIHAPPRGATDCCPKIQAIVVISIHAPPRGATTRT